MGIKFCASVTIAINGSSRPLQLEADTESELFDKVEAYELKGINVYMDSQYLYDTTTNKQVFPARKRHRKSPPLPAPVEEPTQKSTTRARRPRIPTYV